ncbi:PLP-dependent aminotransferase family protein [Arthrobacter sp. zg-Y877]|uniref:aminotransferase-like domain-containing protein n=1 Tax=Arthrobacter sp. zg-Y877 TaxID=3049074 RepID=UPI0025A41349|nr:PLP-dependent aminotransferase family protein [Arthrobacter sp. zg-Y877]MDM7991213.1 PLP-dependent aminotransferase family protein [Arthrobacter sp. zg-Y877]
MADSSSAQRIVAGLRTWILTAAPGAQLPSTRTLVAQYGASPVTVQKALRTLGSLGLVESRPGAGTFVRARSATRPHDYAWQTAALGAPRSIPPMSAALRAVPDDMIALHAGYPDRDLLPSRLVRAAFARAARSEAALSRSPAAGLPDLRAWFAAELGEAAPFGVAPPAPADVVILPGSQSGLSTAFRALVGPGQPLLMESPTYWGAILAAAQAGVQVIPVPSGSLGPDPAEVARAFESTGARAFYAQPTFANPTGAQWSRTRADQILETVRRYGAFLIEDDWAHDFGIAGTPEPLAARDDSGHVVYLRSLTKSVSPSVRVAGIIARGPARERLLADFQASSVYVSGVLQAAALDVVTQPAWQTHLRSLRGQLGTRRDLLVDALQEYAPLVQLDAVPRGGLNLWGRLPDATDVTRFARECENAGVRVAPGTEWFPAEQTGAYLRLNYSGPNPGSFAEGARIIGQTLEQHRQD